eukprot:XP_001694929.1 predicted protein [Chlamydomonas reinhardtii]
MVGCQAPPRPLPDNLFEEWQCKEFRKMCVDQQQFVSYDPRHYGPEAVPLPGYDVHEVVYNLPNPYGNGDKFKTGTALHVAPVEVRRAVPAEEACPDLQRPVFSACTHPLVLWQSGGGGGGDGGGLDPALSLVVATPHGLRLPAYWQLLAGPFFRRQVTSLAEFSARLHVRQGGSGDAAAAAAAPQRSNATAEGLHVRCFERLTMCRVVKRKRYRTTAAGAHLLRHYRDRLPAVSDLFDVEGGDADTLKVVIASRSNATSRSFLNEKELLDACNRLDPGEAYRAASMNGTSSHSNSSSSSSSNGSSKRLQGARPVFRRLKCVPHVFGRNPMYDLSLAKSLDVLVATHGAAGYHSFFMSRGASFVEVLPLGFGAKWANVYYARMLELDKKVFYWAIYIRNSSNAEDSALQTWPTFRKAIGASPAAYKAAYAAGRHVISDGLKRLPHRPKVNDSGWVNYTAGEAVRQARLRLA